MSGEDNKRAVAEFVERCQNQHDLDFADEVFYPEFAGHYRPEGRPLPETARLASGFQAFYGALLRGFPDATVEINEQLAERDLVATRKTFRGTHLGELWDLPPTGNRVELEFIDIFRVSGGKLTEHWTSMDLGAPQHQMRARSSPQTATNNDLQIHVPYQVAHKYPDGQRAHIGRSGYPGGCRGAAAGGSPVGAAA